MFNSSSSATCINTGSTNTVHSVTTTSDFTGILQLNSTFMVGAGGLQMDGGTIYQPNVSNLMLNGDSTWTAGLFDVGTEALVTLGAGMTLLLANGGQKDTEATFKVTNGTVLDIAADQTERWLANASLMIEAGGELKMTSGSSFITGGASTGTITNAGTITRSGPARIAG